LQLLSAAGVSEAPRKEPHFEHFEMAMDEKNKAICNEIFSER